MTEVIDAPAFSEGDTVRVGDVAHLEGIADYTNRVGIVERVINEPDADHDWEFLPCYVVRFGYAAYDCAELFEQELDVVAHHQR